MRHDFDTEEWLNLRRLIVQKFKKTGFSSFSVLENDAIENFLKKFPNHPGGYLLNGYVKWSKKQKIAATKSFNIARDLLHNNEGWLKGLDIGINSLIQVSNDQECLIPAPFSVKLADLNILKKSNLKVCDFVILVSCDENYFNIHGRSMIEYAKREFSDYHVHVHIINPKEDTLTRLAKSHQQNLAVSYEKTDIACRPYFALSRFIVATAVMDLYKSDVYIMDIDSMPSMTFRNSITRLIDQDFDLACTIMPKAWMPWNNYLAGSVYLKNTSYTRAFLNHISIYSANVYQQLNGLEHAWWVDQNALYWAIERGYARVIKINKYGRLIIGPEGLDKHDYSKLVGQLLQSTDFVWEARSSFDELASYLVSFKSISPAVLERILYSYINANNINDTSILEYLLVLYLKKRLDKKFIDPLVAGLLKNKSYGFAASLINDYDGMQSYLPEYFSENLFTRYDKLESESNNAIEMLSPVLNRKSYNLSLSVLKRQYTGSDDEMKKIFYESSIRTLLRMGNIDAAVEEINSKFSKAIVVVGLQRSGTNFIASLLRENTQFYVPQSADTTLFWKHALPDEGGGRVNPIFTSPVDALQQINAQCIVVIKKPLLWIDSIVNRNCVDFFQTRKNYVVSENDIEGLAKFYKNFLGAWAAVDGNVVFISYEAVLENPSMVFNVLKTTPKHEEIILPSKVPMSKLFSVSDKDRYISEKQSLTESQLVVAKSVINQEYLSSVENYINRHK